MSRCSTHMNFLCRKSLPCGFAALLVAGTTLVDALTSQPFAAEPTLPDPSYNGRPLSRWLEDLAAGMHPTPEYRQRAEDAVQHLQATPRPAMSARKVESTAADRRVTPADLSAVELRKPIPPIPELPRERPLFSPKSNAELDEMLRRLREPATRVEALGKLLEVANDFFVARRTHADALAKKLRADAFAALRDGPSLEPIVEELAARIRDRSALAGERVASLVPLMRLSNHGPQRIGSGLGGGTSALGRLLIKGTATARRCRESIREVAHGQRSVRAILCDRCRWRGKASRRNESAG